MTHREISAKGGRSRSAAKLRACLRNAKKARQTLAQKFFKQRHRKIFP